MRDEQSAFDLHTTGALVCFPHSHVKGKLLIEDIDSAIKKTFALIKTEFDKR